MRALDSVALQRLLWSPTLCQHPLINTTQQRDEELYLHLNCLGGDPHAVRDALVRLVEAHSVPTLIYATIVTVDVALQVDRARLVQLLQLAGLLIELLLHVHVIVDHILT